MEYIIPTGNWHIALADNIELAKDGDVIIVQNESQKELGESAKQRMCPKKQIIFEVKR